LIEGPWEHRFVSAGGLRFHVAAAGPDDAPLVVLLHAIPQFWWSMRHQLTAIANAGYRTVAMDLRGFGASDKPPEGYTLPTLAADVAGVIGALGAAKAVVVGQGTGGAVAWTMTSQAPQALHGIVPISSPHPGSRLPKRRLLVSPRAFGQIGRLRTPSFATRAMAKGPMALKLLHTWGARSDWLGQEDAARYAEALRIPFAADKAVDLVRWMARPNWSAAVNRFRAGVRVPAPVPVLHLQGNQDHLLRVSAMAIPGLGGADYQFQTLGGVGHFACEEADDKVNAAILRWLAGLPEY
jgi:pimeloyl-ACP methyl ester carboxylesterase